MNLKEGRSYLYGTWGYGAGSWGTRDSDPAQPWGVQMPEKQQTHLLGLPWVGQVLQEMLATGRSGQWLGHHGPCCGWLAAW